MRILGIDIGSSSIKALEIESAFGNYGIHDYHELELITPEETELVLSKLLGTLMKAPDRIVVSMPPEKVTLRNLLLPTRDKKAIQSGVGFELEDELPFSADESIFDYTVLSQSKAGSQIHVGATLKRNLASLLSRYESAKIFPDLVTSEPWAYYTLLNRALGQQSLTTPVLLINIGQNRTLFYLHKKESPVFLREVTWGGTDLTEAVMKKFGISKEQAESTKIDRGIVPGQTDSKEITPEDAELAKCLEEALDQNFSRELRQVELMCRNITGQSPSQIYLTGGTSLLTGLAPWVQNRIQIPAQLLPALSSITPSGVSYSDQTNARFLLAAGLALCLVGNQRNNSINFRKGEFVKAGKNRELNLKILKKPLIAASVVATSLLMSLIVQSAVYQKRMEATQSSLERSVKTFLGNPSPNTLRNYMANTTTLRSAINKELNKQRELNKLYGANPRSPTDYLNFLSTSIPKDLVVDMTYFQSGTAGAESYVSGNSAPAAQLTFLVSNPQSIERLNTLLTDKLIGVQRGKTEEVSIEGEAQKKWKVSFTGKPIEEPYGK